MVLKPVPPLSTKTSELKPSADDRVRKFVPSKPDGVVAVVQLPVVLNCALVLSMVVPPGGTPPESGSYL